jgi:hypothetical protein
MAARPTARWRRRGLVIRAQDEKAARALPQSQAGHEGLDIYRQLGIDEEEFADDVWLNSTLTSREELDVHGEPGVVLVDRREA